MKISISVIVLLVMMTLPNVAFGYGALAIDALQGDRWGWAVDYPTPEGAFSRAMEECGTNTCFVVMTFNGGAAAYAADQTEGSTAYGWATASTSAEAKQIALDFCRERAGVYGDCIVRVWGEESER